MIEITYDINKQFGKKFSDFRSEEFVNIQYTFRRIFNLFGITTSTCNGIKTTFGTSYSIKVLASEVQESELIDYLKHELGAEKISYEEDKHFCECLIPCKPYVLNPKTNEKMEADDFDLKITISFFRKVEEIVD